jgi:aspartyl-tRNA(Asn)/glutamyl-tRNA(Gln) amidotransferase subunit A
MDQDRRNFLQNSGRLGAFALASAAHWRIDPALAQSGSRSELATMSIIGLSHFLASRKITSRQLVEQALAAIKDPQEEGSRTFLSVHESEALATAERVNARRRGEATLPALAGIPISIKDLFDGCARPHRAGCRLQLGRIQPLASPPAFRPALSIPRAW